MSGERVDVAIIGAGPSGAACARRLAIQGFSVALFKGRRRRGWHEGEVLGPRAVELLVKEAGCVLPPGSLAIEARESRWGDKTPSRFEYRFWHAAPAWVVDRAALDQALCDAAGGAGTHCIEATVKEVSRAWDGWLVTDEERQRWSARFLVEATGRVSRSLAHPEIGRLYLDRLVCHSAVIAGRGNDRPVMRVDATSSGWCYSVPLSRGRELLAWFTDADLRTAPDRAELGGCHAALSRPGVADPVGRSELRTICARTSIRTKLWSGRWLAIGDAAWALDPLSGDGTSRSLADGIAAADAIAASLRSGTDERLRQHALDRAAAFEAALRARRRVYGSVRTWPEEPFWKRRNRRAG